MLQYPRGLAVGCVVALAGGLVSCGPEQVPTTPPPPIVTQPGPTVALSGMVFDHTPNGIVPRANVRLLVRVYQSHTFIEVTSDAMGRYSVPGVTVGSISVAAVGGSGYYTPCPAGSDDIRTSRVLDVHVVSEAQLLVAGVPDDLPLGNIWVYGVVYERVDQGHKLIAGAIVNLDGDASDPRFGSTTITDAAGNFVVCPPIPSTGTDTYAAIRVSREGYRTATRSAFLGWDYENFWIELSRN